MMCRKKSFVYAWILLTFAFMMIGFILGFDGKILVYYILISLSLFAGWYNNRI